MRHLVHSDALWGVVLLRLLVPFQIPSLSLPAAAADLAPELPVLSNRPLSPDTAMGHAVIPSGLLEENGLTIADDGTVQASQSGQDAALWELQENGEVYMYFGGPTLDDVLRAAVVMVWAAGAGGVLLAVLAANLRFAQKLRRSRRPLPTAGCPLPVYEAEGLSSPCLYGVLRPAVYLTPEAAADGTVRTHVLSHELTHFRHRDHIWSLLRCLALAQFYLDLDPRHPKAVTSAQLSQAEVYDAGETAFCARITLALDPVEPNTVYWMAGAGIDLAEANSPWAGLWLDTHEYRLERQADGSWRCTEAATGGLRAD